MGDDKSCYDIGPALADPSSGSYTFDFHKGANSKSKGLGTRTKPTPSKWDDAQKWLVSLSTGARDHHHSTKSSKTKPRNSNADDRRLLSSLSQRARDSCSSADRVILQDDGETKKIDCGDGVWRVGKPAKESSAFTVRSVCVRDMGTEMTPVASQEPSRTGTPLRATTPVLRSPISSRSSTPGRSRQGGTVGERKSDLVTGGGRGNGGGWAAEKDGGRRSGREEQVGNPANSLESRAMAWDEAEKAKYMARYKREEVKIEAWENHEKRKAEMEMRRMEVKAERLKIRSQEKLANKLAATRRIAEEKRANAEAELNERAARTSERADYIRRTGHLPFSFSSFKLPSLCG